MESCDSPVKITVGGIEWYYQTFYKDDGNVDAVRLYDKNGEFVREFKNLDKLSVWLKRRADTKREELAKRVAKKIEKYDVEKKRRLRNEWIPESEKAKTQAIFMKRLSEIMGEMSLTEFSDKLGLSVGVVKQYLDGGRFPSGHVFKRIANRCGVTTDWLLGRDCETSTKVDKS